MQATETVLSVIRAYCPKRSLESPLRGNSFGGFGKGPTEKDPYTGHLTGGLLHWKGRGQGPGKVDQGRAEGSLSVWDGSQLGPFRRVTSTDATKLR
jgi:hypothetical protein